MEIFEEYILAFMQVFLDDFAMYSQKTEHLNHLRMCLEKCWTARLSLNPAKCAFEVTSGALLGPIISRDRIVADPDKVKEILQAPRLTNAKALSRFLEQIRCHSQIL